MSGDHVRPAGARAAPGIWPEGWTVWHVAETGSTNADLLALLESRGEAVPDRTVLATGHQTAGRGRLDRRWDAPPGANLLVSILFRDVPADPGELVRRVGLAAVAAARHHTDGVVALKWPNDVLLDGSKLAGILAQRSPLGPVVVGAGINVGWAPDGAARLAGGVEPPAVLADLLAAFDELPADVTDRYRAELATLGSRVRVQMASGDVVGTAVDVTDDGRLVVLDECAITHRIDVGDVVHLRPA